MNISSLILMLAILFLTTMTSTKPMMTSAGPTTINLVALGANPDGSDDSAPAFIRAWTEACRSGGPKTIYVPEGEYLVGSPVRFDGKSCKSKNRVRFVIKGKILGPENYEDLSKAGNWFVFEDVAGVLISGGVFNGRGEGLWACKRSGRTCPRGATTIRFKKCKNIEINGVTSLNSQLYHIVIDECKNVKVKGVKVYASGSSPNTDGIHVEKSIGVTISNTKIGTGDDCVSIGAGTNNLWIENVDCGPGHGISIGSLGKDENEEGVQNVTVKSATFTETKNGVRIKSWGRPSNGFVTNILFQHLTMVNAQNPIIIDQNYCPNQIDCPGKVSGVKISDVTYQHIHGSSATSIAMKFDCSANYHCTNIKLDDIKLTYKNQHARSSCVNADGSTSGLIQPKSCF